MSPRLEGLFEELDGYEGCIPIDELVSIMKRHQVGRADLEHCIQFDDSGYRRNLLREGSAYQALCLCWLNGQRSAIHDHRGSSCGLQVVSGTLTETIFEPGPNGLIMPTCSREQNEGCICGSYDQDIHQISNLQADGAELITIHVYSPPLVAFGTYSLTDNEVREVVCEDFTYAE